MQLAPRPAVIFVAAAVAALAAGASPAQAQSELQLWLEGGLRHDLGPRTTFTFDQHLRFDRDLGRVGSVMPEPGLVTRAARWLRVGVSYRLQYERNKDDAMELRHRFHLFARARGDVAKALRLEYRLQLQEQVRPDANDLYRHTVRNRIGLVYRGLRRWEPAADIELHHAIDDGDAIHLEKLWLTFAVGRPLGAGDVEVLYRIELPRFDPAEPTLHILGLGFHADV